MSSLHSLDVALCPDWTRNADSENVQLKRIHLEHFNVPVEHKLVHISLHVKHFFLKYLIIIIFLN